LAEPLNYKEVLDRGYLPGRDIRIAFGDANISRCLLVAPHGGGIEPGTSELLRAVAELGNWAWYEFAGFLRNNNHQELHIASTRFDEPILLGLLPKANFIVTLHGSQALGEPVAHIGGTWDQGRAGITAGINSSTARHGIQAIDAPAHLKGADPANITNRGRLGHGIQIELSRSARNLLFPPDCSREARGKRSPGLAALAKAIHASLKQLAAA
jgi:phage replication-related protein YjqB (UPF0714/DUF867 family)